MHLTAPSFTYCKFMYPDLLLGPNPPLEEFRVEKQFISVILARTQVYVRLSAEDK